jgi:hypothetical protein
MGKLESFFMQIHGNAYNGGLVCAFYRGQETRYQKAINIWSEMNRYERIEAQSTPIHLSEAREKCGKFTADLILNTLPFMEVLAHCSSFFVFCFFPYYFFKNK